MQPIPHTGVLWIRANWNKRYPQSLVDRIEDSVNEPKTYATIEIGIPVGEPPKLKGLEEFSYPHERPLIHAKHLNLVRLQDPERRARVLFESYAIKSSGN